MAERKAQTNKPDPTLGSMSASGSPSEEEVRQEIERILDSPIFSQSDRLARFLRFTAEHVLSGKGDTLKEYLIGVSVYDRRPPYHPSQDSIVRTEARRLRAKLKEYYDTLGAGSSVFVYYRPGSYSPVFRRASTDTVEASDARRPDPSQLLAPGAGVGLVVLPFVDLSANPLSSQCAQGLTDELIHALTQTDGLRVVSRAAVAHLTATAWDMAGLLEKLNAVCALEGAVRLDGNRIRVTIRVVHPNGFQSSSHRFETLADSATIAETQRQIVSAFISRAKPLQSRIRKRQAGAGPLTLAVYPLVVHAETMLNEGSAADIRPAMFKFQEAIELAPTFARSYYGLAQCHMELALRGAPRSRDLVFEAITSAEKAVSLDPEMFGCYSTLATAQALAWEWKAADECYEAATQLGIHAPSSRQYALYLALNGRFTEGFEQLEISQTIDPFSYRHKVAVAKFLHLAKRFEELLSLPLHMGKYGDVPLECKILTALAATHIGDHARALKIVGEIQSEHQPQSLMITSVAEVLALAGEHAKAQALVEDYYLLTDQSPLSAFRKSLLALAIGDEDECLALLHRSCSLQEAELIWLKAEHRFAAIRESTNYKEIVAQIFDR